MAHSGSVQKVSKKNGSQTVLNPNSLSSFELERIRTMPNGFVHSPDKFENLKNVHLTTDQIRCGDLIDAMKRMAEINLIGELRIDYSRLKESEMYIDRHSPVNRNS